MVSINMNDAVSNRDVRVYDNENALRNTNNITWRLPTANDDTNGKTADTDSVSSALYPDGNDTDSTGTTPSPNPHRSTSQ